ncbi:protein Dok-7-like [Sycon ciliatum]|uniref:protein Dok-7-like n=1 Tax=Sycon ciliatum TaxID=27933 RepID=UPI0031F62E16
MYPASADRILVEGEVLYRDRQKWRSRWCCMKKTNPAGMPHTQLLIYASKPDTSRASPQERHSLEDFCGLDYGRPLEGEANVLTVITAHISYTFAFKVLLDLERWTRILKRELGSEWMFDVKVLPTQNKIKAGEATLRFFPSYFSLTSGNPCACLGYWMHNQLRRYGGSSGFSFEAGSKCYGGEGVYRLESKHGAKIKDLFDRVANNRPLPDPLKMSMSSARERSSMGSDSAPETSPVGHPAVLVSSNARSVQRASDSSELYTLPPTMAAAAGGNSSSGIRTSSSSIEHRQSPMTPNNSYQPVPSATSPVTPVTADLNMDRPPMAVPSASLQTAPQPEGHYENMGDGGSNTYAYVPIKIQPRSIPDANVNYAKLDQGSLNSAGNPGSTALPVAAGARSSSASGGSNSVGSLPSHFRGRMSETTYSSVDIDNTHSLRVARDAQARDRQRPIEQ